MANIMLNSAAAAYAKGEIAWVTDDIRARLLMTTTTADTENDGIVNIADYTTLGQDDDTAGNHTQALANKAVNTDDPNDRAEADADDASYTGRNGDSSNDIQGVLIYKHVDGTDANDIALAFVDFASDVAGTASQIDVPWDAEGIKQLRAGTI